ncbi:urea ABC transporter permease subunit UrtB [Pelagicoccus enzymogenes]|uniref:urea ABC transporter permease subunit UrtB n=1 Tax=Pelagicoccus enzymogenes TaxID=2773457 RepID=UPI00280D27B7|nr:urea ABC transporter permease subunit UrtB [Pelagicoccus enzymogenes]MDQ8196510.1 urea ABC transporter permease subunit UrtB [Pelagicoccus enzymogenes]
MKKSLFVLLLTLVANLWGQDDPRVRQLLEDLALERADDQDALLDELANSGDSFVTSFVDAWRTGEVYQYAPDGSDPIIVIKVSEAYIQLSTWDELELTPSQIEEIEDNKSRPSRRLRRTLSRVTDTVDLASKDVGTRKAAALKLGQSQNQEYLEILRARLEKEENSSAAEALREAIAISLLANYSSPEELKEAIAALGEFRSIGAKSKIETIRDKALEEGDEDLAAIATQSVKYIEDHEAILRHAGSIFRGISTGSILLIVAFGLAITFGLMGIINMAHGEFVAIGGYTCYVMNQFFSEAYGTQSDAYQWFFWCSIPLSFLVAGTLGWLLEISFFRFLYKRPLESLLATWGLSMVMRQMFRLIFGAANVQVGNPEVLSGNVEFWGLAMSEARIFAIGFAGFVALLTWALLTKTNLGLFIRAVMQNRNMASSLGIPVKRVNSLTFAFGCGLAAMAGAVLSQIGNVGPEMGQAYIVQSFMVVVVGGVGNLLGAGLSALGIGVVDQILQPLIGPIMGTIAVLFIIILFLQRKPGGLFPTKSRSMED